MKLRFGRLVAVLALTTLAACGESQLPPPVDASTGTDGATRCEYDSDCDDDRFCNGAERCGSTTHACAAGTTPCEAGHACMEASDSCSTECGDLDSDGVTASSCGGEDCDDADPNRYPGATEVCDSAGHDEDCDPLTFGQRDLDSDGAIDATCCNADGATPRCGIDCDDTRAGVSPTATEACNRIDDDCDTNIDEMAQVSVRPDADGDGYGDSAATAMLGCAGTPLTSTVDGDCNDAAPGIHVGAPEVCNGIDDDCDGQVDDIRDDAVVCASGSTQSCTTTAGLAGSQGCRADCLALLACTATEACNGADDDLDGAVDNGFACARGALLACSTTCGTAGTATCSASCEPGACRAAEICNFCDDDGVAGISGEKPLATVSETRSLEANAVAVPPVTTSVEGVASVSARSTGSGGYENYARLLDGATANQAGAYWVSLTRYQGWAPTTILAEMRVQAVDSGTLPVGGWSVVVRTSGGGGVGAPRDRGVPLSGSGARFDWIWGYDGTMGPELGDRAAYGRLPSSWKGTIFAGTAPVYGRPVPSALSFDGTTSPLTQRLVIVYQPDDPYTVADEEYVTVATPLPSETTPCTTTASTCSPGLSCVAMRGGTAGTCMTATNYFDGAFLGGVDPAHEIPFASTLSIGFTAGSYSWTFNPPGGPPGGIPIGGRVRADLILHSFTPPPAGSGGSGWHVDHTAVTRAGICAGPY